jgi:hypothetical protein
MPGDAEAILAMASVYPVLVSKCLPALVLLRREQVADTIVIATASAAASRLAAPPFAGVRRERQG